MHRRIAAIRNNRYSKRCLCSEVSCFLPVGLSQTPLCAAVLTHRRGVIADRQRTGKSSRQGSISGRERATICRLLYGWGLFVSSCGATHVRYWYSRACHEFDQECPLSTALPKVRGHRGHTMRRTSPVYSSPFYSLFIPPQNMPTARPRSGRSGLWRRRASERQWVTQQPPSR